MIPTPASDPPDLAAALAGTTPAQLLRLLHQALDALHLGITIADLQGRILYVNRAEAELHGYTVDELLGQPARILGAPERHRPFDLRRRRRWVRESVNVRKDGTRFPVRLISDVLVDAQGQPIAIVTCSEDISDEVAIRQEATLQRAYLEELFEGAPEAIVLVDAQDRVLRVNAEFTRLFGYSAAEALGRRINDLIVPPELASEGQLLTEQAASGVPVAIETIRRRKDGTRLHVSLLAKPIHVGGRQVAVYGIYRDITAQKRLERQLLEQAFYDPLTGLPNRAMALHRLQVAADSPLPGVVAALLIDIDRLGAVNELLGYAAADQILVELGRRLRQAAGADALVARWAGDEFLVVLESLTDAAAAADVAERVLAVFEEPFDVPDRRVPLSAGVGVALTQPGVPWAPETLLRHASLALQRAKRSGVGPRYDIFDAARHAAVAARLQLELALREALERDQLDLHYQPIVALATGEVVAVEALVRWRHPDRGLLGAQEFIAIAETSGLVIPLGRWVLRQAAATVRALQRRLGRPLGLNVNLSVPQLTDPGLVDTVAATLHEVDLAPEHLRLELTESVLLDNPETAAARLRELKALGVQIHIDDFGTGYSSLSYLHQLPLDALKIDRAFVRLAAPEPGPLLRGIVALAHGLGLAVVAEGVETPEQRAGLLQLRAEYAQGYVFAPPLAADELARLLERPTPW